MNSESYDSSDLNTDTLLYNLLGIFIYTSSLMILRWKITLYLLGETHWWCLRTGINNWGPSMRKIEGKYMIYFSNLRPIKTKLTICIIYILIIIGNKCYYLSRTIDIIRFIGTLLSCKFWNYTITELLSETAQFWNQATKCWNCTVNWNLLVAWWIFTEFKLKSTCRLPLPASRVVVGVNRKRERAQP